jgi:hypothetical protein
MGTAFESKGDGSDENLLRGKASIILEFNRHPPAVTERDIKEEILGILKRRPLSLKDLSQGMGIREDEIENCIQSLVSEGTIHARFFGDSIYYEIN